jgi:hypothetical protein
MVEVAIATIAQPCVATPALEVYQLAATSGDSRGQVCPFTGEAGLTWHGSDLSARDPQSGSDRDRQSVSALRLESGLVRGPQTGIATRYGATFGAFSVMNNVSTSKPRTGYCAMSGTG